MKSRNLCIFAASVALLTLGTPGAFGTTYNWVGTTNGSWGTSTNWDTSPVFNTSADLVFNNDMGDAYVTYLGASRQIRSLEFGDSLTSTGSLFQVRALTTIGSGGAVLYMDGGTGNASITMGSGLTKSVYVGTEDGSSAGTVVFQTDMDIYQNSTTANLYIDSTFNGSSNINKYGAGTFVLRRNGENFSGNVNINQGTVLVYNDNRATGTGNFVIGQSGGADDATLQIGSFWNGNFTNNVIVSAGSGARIIKNDSGGNATMSGGSINLSAGKDVTFDVTAYDATNKEINGGVGISGTGGVVKNGDGDLIYWSANDYTGDTVINGGTLTVKGAGTINGSSVTVNASGTLDIQNSMVFSVGDSANTQIVGTGLLSYTGTMILDLSSFTGATGSWVLIDVPSLASGSTVALSAVQDRFGTLTFSENSGVWTSNDGNWSFSEATGTLTAIPEPSAVSLAMVLASLGLAYGIRRRRSR